MKKSQVYDERQILERGKAYRYGFFAAMLTFLLFYVLRDFFEIAIDGYVVLIGGIWIPLTVCLVLLIVKDAYDSVNSTAGRTAMSVYGLVGVFLIGYCVYEILFEGLGVYQDGMVTRITGSLFMGSCMILNCIVYWIKQYVNQKQMTEE